MAATGAQLTDAAEARAYIETFLEVTRGSMVIVEPVTSLADLHWRPGSDNEERAKAALIANPPPMEPVAERTDGGFHVELTLVVDQRLQRNEFDLTGTGEIRRSSFRILAERLPLPIAR